MVFLRKTILRTVIVLTIKQLKRRVVQGLVEPELFYMPVKKTEREPMVIKILVNNINNNLLVIPLTKSIYCSIKAFKYSNMEQEYERYLIPMI